MIEFRNGREGAEDYGRQRRRLRLGVIIRRFGRDFGRWVILQSDRRERQAHLEGGEPNCVHGRVQTETFDFEIY